MVCNLFLQDFTLKPVSCEGYSYITDTSSPPSTLTTFHSYLQTASTWFYPTDTTVTVKDNVSNLEVVCGLVSQQVSGMGTGSYTTTYKQTRLQDQQFAHWDAGGYSHTLTAGRLSISWGCRLDVPSSLRQDITANPTQSSQDYALTGVIITSSSSSSPTPPVTYFEGFPISKKIIRKYYDIDGVLYNQSEIYLYMYGGHNASQNVTGDGFIRYEYNSQTQQKKITFSVDVPEMQIVAPSRGQYNFRFNTT